MKRSTLLFAALALVLTLLVAGILIRRSKASYMEAGSIKKGRIVEAIYGLGTVTARNTYQAKLGVTGRIRKLSVKEGDTVKKGDPLVSVEGATTFTAPFNATVTSLPFKEGETVFPQLTLVTLTDLSDTYIVVSLDQRSAMKVRAGQPVALSFEGNRDQTVSAKVASVYPNAGQFLVRVDSDAIPASALPGMTVDVAIQVATKENALIAPVSAVQKNTLIIGKSRQPVSVTTGLIDGSYVEILSGEVKENDRVYVRAK